LANIYAVTFMQQIDGQIYG